MAGHGPPPKESRVHSRIPVRGDWVTLPSAAFAGERPDLKGLPIEGALSKASKDAWDVWWSSPMAHQWTRSDWPALRRLLVLTELVARATRRAQTAGLSSLLAELRQLEDRFGISEKGRRDLRWRLPDPDDEPEPRTRRRRTTTSEMRARLTVVEGSGAD